MLLPKAEPGRMDSSCRIVNLVSTERKRCESQASQEWACCLGSVELEEARRQATEDAAKLREEAEAAEQSEKEARERADRMENAGLFARIFRSW